jgi:hypothetical protein
VLWGSITPCLSPTGYCARSHSQVIQTKLRPPGSLAWKGRATATLVIDGEAIIGFQANRQRVDELLA